MTARVIRRESRPWIEIKVNDQWGYDHLFGVKVHQARELLLELTEALAEIDEEQA